MKCSYCGGDSTSFEKCSCCGSPISDEDIETEVDRICEARQAGEIQESDSQALLSALKELHKRKNFKKADLLGKILEIFAINQYKEWEASPNGKSKEEACSSFREMAGCALSIYETGAENGNVLCMLRTADFYHNGIIGEADETKYIYWLKKAAAEGSDEAKELLRDAESSEEEVVTPEVSSGAIWTIVGLIVTAILVGLKILIAFSH